MQAAPPSWRAATKRAPWSIRALVTWKLPLPTTPNTISAPRPVSTAPAASLTSISPARSGPFHQGERPARTARAAGDRQRGHDNHRALRRQQRQVLQLGEPVLGPPQQRRVARERRVERMPRPGVRSHRPYPEPDDRRLPREPAGTLHRNPRRVRARLVRVQERVLVA